MTLLMPDQDRMVVVATLLRSLRKLEMLVLHRKTGERISLSQSRLVCSPAFAFRRAAYQRTVTVPLAVYSVCPSIPYLHVLSSFVTRFRD